MYEYLDHPSEELIRVTAGSVDAIFNESAIALFELMTDTARIKSDLSYNVDLQSDDRMQLFIDWLNRLILLHEVEHVFLNTFQAHVLTGSPWSLNAVVKGQKIEEGLERRLHVKSATYGQLQWRETPQGHQVEFVVDV